MDSDHPLKILISRRILAVEGDSTHIQFQTDIGTHAFESQGECCSTSWFEHATGIENIIGRTIVEVCSVDMNNDDFVNPAARRKRIFKVLLEGTQEEDSDTVIEVYGFQIKSDLGVSELEMRNSSNGYYGGSIEIAEPRVGLKSFEDF